MRMKDLLFVSIVTASFMAVGCGGAANTNTANTTNTNAANTATKDAMTNAAPTLTPVFKAYCEAWAKKDEAGIRKAYSADTLKYFEEGMKEEKIQSLMKYLEDDAITGNICEARNEVITGDKAVAEIRADKFPNGIKIEFVKENGEWKMTNKSPTVDGVKNSPASDTAPPASGNTANRPAADPAAKKDN